MRFNLVIEIEAKDVQWCPNHDLLTYGFPGKHDWTAISNFYRLFKFEKLRQLWGYSMAVSLIGNVMVCALRKE